jgi:hypothetical protein
VSAIRAIRYTLALDVWCATYHTMLVGARVQHEAPLFVWAQVWPLGTLVKTLLPAPPPPAAQYVPPVHPAVLSVPPLPVAPQ